MAKAIWKYCYWLDEQQLEALQQQMKAQGIRMTQAEKNVCEALLGDIGYAEPSVWPLICKHDAAPWYEKSPQAGRILVASSFELDEQYSPFLETTLEPVSFIPPVTPSPEDMARMAQDAGYKSREPEGWGAFPREMGEAIVKGLAKMHDRPPEEFQDLLTAWTANHANFVNPSCRADAAFENAPYSITDSAHISSCCVELFNLLDSTEKALLVRPCIGGVIVKALQRDQYYRVNIVKNIQKNKG